MSFKPFNIFYVENIPLRTTAGLKAGEGDYFIRQRRNLFSLAVGLIVFEIAGGTITGQNILGGAVTIKHQGIIHFSLYAALIYFAYRYKLFAPPFWASLQRDKSNLIVFSNEKSFHEIFSNNLKWIERIVEKKLEKDNAIIIIEYAHGLNPRMNSDATKHHAIQLLLPIEDYRRMKLLANIRVWFSTDTFTEVGLPYLLFFIALSIGLFKITGI